MGKQRHSTEHPKLDLDPRDKGLTAGPSGEGWMEERDPGEGLQAPYVVLRGCLTWLPPLMCCVTLSKSLRLCTMVAITSKDNDSYPGSHIKLS